SLPLSEITMGFAIALNGGDDELTFSVGDEHIFSVDFSIARGGGNDLVTILEPLDLQGDLDIIAETVVIHENVSTHGGDLSIAADSITIDNGAVISTLGSAGDIILIATGSKFPKFSKLIILP
ncbi:MAG: hypothetical protein O7H40_11495, partial [Gammaproteobacteria bacterium]|nr:hypothetical protein [Gammaproteobacteria bacterium]